MSICQNPQAVSLFLLTSWVLQSFPTWPRSQREFVHSLRKKGSLRFLFSRIFSLHNFVGLWQSQTFSPVPLRHGLWLGLDCSCPKPCGWGAGQKKWGKCGSFWYSCFWEIRCPTISACGNARLFCHVYHHCLCNSK